MNRTFKWYYKERNILILLIVCFPFGIYLMFKYTQWSPRFKLAVTGFYTLVTVTLLVLLGVWIFIIDHNPSNSNLEIKYNCQEDADNQCLINAVANDLDSLINKNDLNIIPHESITIKYPNTTLEITSTQKSDINSYLHYRNLSMDIIKTLNMDELFDLGYIDLEINYVGTYFESDIPHTETVLTYKFTIEDYIGTSWEKQNIITFDNNITYNNEMFDEEIK